jgi:hypothetical protein
VGAAKEPACRGKEKESSRRLETMEKASEGIPSGTKVTHVCDREGNMAD